MEWITATAEIESFNMSDLDVNALDVRLELTSVLPEVIACGSNCPHNCVSNCDTNCTGNECGYNTGCMVND
jgi:hypothetical protein